ncbi:hypothetical protein [Thermovibrio sp.]
MTEKEIHIKGKIRELSYDIESKVELAKLTLYNIETLEFKGEEIKTQVNLSTNKISIRGEELEITLKINENNIDEVELSGQELIKIADIIAVGDKVSLQIIQTKQNNEDSAEDKKDSAEDKKDSLKIKSISIYEE